MSDNCRGCGEDIAVIGSIMAPCDWKHEADCLAFKVLERTSGTRHLNS